MKARPVNDGGTSNAYVGSGGEISAGDQDGYAYNEDGTDDTSYSYTVNNSVADDAWTATGSGNECDNGDDHYSYTDGGSDAVPGGGNAAWTDNGGNTDYYGYTTGYDLSESGDWYVSGGSGGSSGTGQDHTTSSMSNVPYQYASPMGGKMKGTYNQNSDAHTSYSYTTTATYEPDEEDGRRRWTETGSQTCSGSGTDHYDYSGSGKYSQSGGGWSASGRMSESGGYDDSYSSQVNYSLSSGSWLETSGTASGTGSGGDHSSYSGTGNYWPAGNGNTMTGDFSNSGSANTTYGYSLNATDSSGNWTWSGGNTYNEHDYGGDKDLLRGQLLAEFCRQQRRHLARHDQWQRRRQRLLRLLVPLRALHCLRLDLRPVAALERQRRRQRHRDRRLPRLLLLLRQRVLLADRCPGGRHPC